MRCSTTLPLAAMAGLMALPLAAEEPDCDDPVTQLDMNICALQAWQSADAELTAAYSVAVDKARRIDGGGGEIFRRAGGIDTKDVPTEEMLRRSQSAWIAYRDASCLVYSDIARGGSMQPMLYSSCAEGLTRARTEQLLTFGDFD